MKLQLLIQEGIGKFRHFRNSKGRIVKANKIGEEIFRRENDPNLIDFEKGAQKKAKGYSIKRVERTQSGVIYYTIVYYNSIRRIKNP